MKKSVQIIIMLAIVAIAFAGCTQEPLNGLSMSRPAKYELTADGDLPIKVNITFIGRMNQTGGYTETDPQPNTIEAKTPWEYTMLTCKDCTYFLSAEIIDTTNAVLTARVIIDGNTVAEDTGQNILLNFEE